MFRFLKVWIAMVFAMGAASISADDPSSEKKFSKADLQFFEAKIRPILVDKCYECHSADTNNAEGGLRLDSRDAILRGGTGGPAIVPGDPKRSLIIRAVEYHDANFQMPPEDAGGKLNDTQIKDLTRWVKMGSPDPRKDASHLNPTLTPNESAKSWWAYLPIQTTIVPERSDWTWNDIDCFIAQGHTKQKVAPVVDATPEALVRRLYFDLTGLPPSPREVNEFTSSIKSGKPRQEALRIVVDRLLDSEQFGVQWGRHWLDVARYAESTGRESNLPYNHAWRYRDYVIHAFNKNTPFDQFLMCQIAGDLMPAKDDHERADNIVATGFLAVGSRNINEGNAKQFAVDEADEQIDSVFQATMATTFACARCHDHKFEPISQRDYTALAGIFLSTETHTGVSGGPNAKNGTAAIDLSKDIHLQLGTSAVSKEDIAKKTAQLNQLRKEIIEGEEELKSDKKDKKASNDPKSKAPQKDLRKLAQQYAELQYYLSHFNSDGTPKPQAMGASDKPIRESDDDPSQKKLVRFLGMRKPSFAKIDDSPFYARGDIGLPGDRVKRSVPNLFGDASKFHIPNGSSGRLELAHWIINSDNPLTPRVAVNRVWHWMMGHGLVDSLDNFGTTGSLPSHPELLDHLATQFVKEGWNVKWLIREIATSRCYQLSSTVHHPDNMRADPENRFHWKGNGRRLQAEEIRDSLLAVSGKLDRKPHAGTTMSRHVGNKINTGLGRKRDKGEVVSDDICRSIYLSLPRNAGPELLELFDLPDATAVQGAREATNVPSQSLFMLNNPTLSTYATALAKDMLKQHPGKGNDNFEKRLRAIYETVLCRHPSSEEERFARKLLIQSENPEVGWTSVVRGLFATAEFRYID